MISHIKPGSNSRFPKISIRNPIGSIILLLILGFFLYSIFNVCTRVITRFKPYEGTVIAIKNDWINNSLSEDSTGLMLLIRIKSGKIIKRAISLENKLHSRITIDDYIIKKKGFRNRTRVKNKKTVSELLEE